MASPGISGYNYTFQVYSDGEVGDYGNVDFSYGIFALRTIMIGGFVYSAYHTLVLLEVIISEMTKEHDIFPTVLLSDVW